MIKSGKNVVFPIILCIVFTVFTGFTGKPGEAWAAGQNLLAGGAGVAATGELLYKLKEKMGNVSNDQEFRAVVDDFNSLPGPNAAAARVLLDYLRYKNANDAWNVKDTLVKLMTEEQVAQLAKDISAYHEANSDRYLVPVLAVRTNNPNDLTNALLSLQNSYFSGKYLQLITQTWPRIFADPTGAVQWLDETYVKLGNPKARQSLVQAVGTVAQKQPSGGSGRSALVGWLWRAQEKELDQVYRCSQLFTLYQLGETRALETIDSLYSSLTSARERAGLIRKIAGFTRQQLKEAGKDGLLDWLWKTAKTDVSPYCRQECLATLYTDLGQEKALERFIQDTEQNGVATLIQVDNVFSINGPDWRLLRDAAQKYPQSYLGRGIKAYEAVRGQSYFEIDRPEEQFKPVWVPPYGDEEYSPD
jgi:hypothetical protein